MTPEQAALLIIGIPAGYLLAAWWTLRRLVKARQTHKFWRIDER